MRRIQVRSELKQQALAAAGLFAVIAAMVAMILYARIA
jgi:hypothetical protein